MSTSITIIDTTIPIIEYQGQRVITLALIDQLHRRPEGTAKRNFSYNKERFIEGKHFFHLSHQEVKSLDEFRSVGIEPNSQGLIVLTERGYSMLVKSFTDDFAWEVQEQLVDGYFDTHKPMSTAEYLLQQAQLIVEHERRIQRLENGQQVVASHVLDAKREAREANEKATEAFEAASAALTHKFGQAGFYTVVAFAKAKGLHLDLNQAKLRGARASQLSREKDSKIIRVPDERFGNVNSYHESILFKVFEDLL